MRPASSSCFSLPYDLPERIDADWHCHQSASIQCFPSLPGQRARPVSSLSPVVQAKGSAPGNCVDEASRLVEPESDHHTTRLLPCSRAFANFDTPTASALRLAPTQLASVILIPSWSTVSTASLAVPVLALPFCGSTPASKDRSTQTSPHIYPVRQTAALDSLDHQTWELYILGEIYMLVSDGSGLCLVSRQFSSSLGLKPTYNYQSPGWVCSSPLLPSLYCYLEVLR